MDYNEGGKRKKNTHGRERETNTDSQKQKRRKFSSLQSTFLSPHPHPHPQDRGSRHQVLLRREGRWRLEPKQSLLGPSAAREVPSVIAKGSEG